MDTHPSDHADDSIDLADLFRRLKRGLPAVIGLTLLGIAAGITLALLASSRQTTVSTMRVSFGFPGSERGAYPNGTKFQSDDVRAPDVVNDAVNRLGLNDSNGDLVSRVRGAISVTGLVPLNIVKERDRLRAAGQSVPPYFPDEYEIALSLPRQQALDGRQRQVFLGELVNAYRDKFRRTYVEPPQQFANAFDALENADFTEYELILNEQMHALRSFLEQQTKNAKHFRSPTSGLSFEDLLRNVELFSQTRLNDVLSIVYLAGLSKDRARAMAKMDYRLRTLEDQEQRLTEEASVVGKLLESTQQRAQSYVVASKADIPSNPQPILDQSLIDALLANDAYNFLVRRALDAGLALTRVQAEKALVLERRKRMESFVKGEATDQAEMIQSAEKALADLQSSYQALLNNVRTCLEDYARQEYADAIRVTMQPMTASWLRPLAVGAAIGGFTLAAFGLGLSLLNLAPASGRAKSAEAKTAATLDS